MTVLTEAAKKIKISPELQRLYTWRDMLVLSQQHHKVNLSYHKLGLTRTEEELAIINKKIAEQEAKDNVAVL